MRNCKMKKILIVNNNLDMGGIQRSLVNLLKELSGEYDITLLLFSKSGALLGEIPEGVKVITPSAGYRVLGLDKKKLKKHLVLFGLKASLSIYTRIFSRRSAMKLLGLCQRKITGYDTVISYSHFPHHKYFGNGCGDFVLDQTISDNKICFIHCDYLNFGGRTEANDRAYMEFDKIACCSDSVRECFLLGSGLQDKRVYTVRNFYDLSLTDYCTDGICQFDEQKINILMISRLSSEKGIPRAIEALFLSQRTDIHYYVIGDGPQKEEIRHTIKKYQLEHRVTMLGEQTQPYADLMGADYLLVPSFHEAAPMVFDEAKLLGTPVITTDTTSAREMIGSKYGIICENSTDGIARALKNIKKSPGNHCGDFDNETQLRQFDKLLRS